MPGRLSARRAQVRPARTNRRKIKLDFLPFVKRLEQRVQRVRPSLDGILDRIVPHRQIMRRSARRQRRQKRDVMLLHRETHAAPAQQQEKILPEKLHAIHIGETAIKHAAVVGENRLTAKLHRPHARQHAFRRHVRKHALDHVAQRTTTEGFRKERRVVAGQRRQRRGQRSRKAFIQFSGEKRLVHLHHALDAFGERLATSEFGAMP